MAREINFVTGTLDAVFTSSDSTFDFTISKQMQRNDGTYYDLTDDKTASLITEFEVEIEDKGTSKVELLRVNGLSSNGTTSDGRPKYTATVETNGATKLRGLANTYDGTNGTGNVISANTVTTFAKNSKVKVTVNRGSFQRLEDTFTAGTTTNTSEAGEDLAIRESVSLHTDGKLYLYHSTNYPNLVGVVNAAYSTGETSTYTTFGGVSTGHSSLTVGATYYAENTGAVTSTSSSTTTILGTAETATTIRIAKAPDADTTLTQTQVEDSTDTTTGNVSGQLLNQGVVGQLLGFRATALENFSDNDIGLILGYAGYSDIDNSDSNYNVIIGDQSGRTKRAYVIFGNGVSMSSLNMAFKKVGSPGDNLTVRIETDSSGPSGTLADANADVDISGASLTTSFADTTVTFPGSFTLTNNTLYWLVLERTGAVDGSNYYISGGLPRPAFPGANHNGTSWTRTIISNGGMPYLSCSGIKTSGMFKPSGSMRVDLLSIFGGFAEGSITAGNTGVFQRFGVKDGFSGLIPGAYYRPSGNTLEIDDSSYSLGSSGIGQAISTTELFINNDQDQD